MHPILERYDQHGLRKDLIAELRTLAVQGAKTAEMVSLIHTRLHFDKPAVIPVLAYMTRAFCIPLREALPLRELIGTDLDEEMDDLIKPEIERRREEWLNGNGDTSKLAASES